MKIIAVSQARSGSSRLPGKIMKDIHGMSMLELHSYRVMKSKLISKFIVATTTETEDDQVVELVKQFGCDLFRGSLNDVLDRYYQAVKDEQPDYVVRITSDCPLVDPVLIDKVIQYAISNNLDYCSNTLNPTYPDGQDVEVFRFAALEKAWKSARLESEREHVTPYIWKNSTFKGGAIFRSANFEEGYDFESVRMTVDETPDLEVIRGLVDALGVDSDWLTYTDFLVNASDLRGKNKGISRNEGFVKSIQQDKYVR
ncbi:MAG: LPS biosynthesis protein [Bacteroidetes bacterium]|nr:LPS biosynthesis protein [Bacteroidota bacterium]